MPKQPEGRCAVKIRAFFQRYGKRLGTFLRHLLTFGAAGFALGVAAVYATNLSPQERGIAWLGIVAFVGFMLGLALISDWTGNILTRNLQLFRFRYQLNRELGQLSEAIEPEEVDVGLATLEAFVNASDEQRDRFIPPQPSWYYPRSSDDEFALPEDLEEEP